MHKTIELITKILIGATFMVPLVVVPSTYIFPFIVPKILLFRILVLLMLTGCIALYASNYKKYKTKFSPTNIVVGLFFISFTLSTFIGVDWYRSFWDNHERMLGLFTIFHYVVFYYIVTNIIREWSDWRWLLRLFLVSGGLVMLIGIWQRLINPELLLNRGSNRVSATLGNAIYYSGYGLFLLFIGYFLATKEKIRTFWWWFAVIGAFFGLLGIFFGGTRGTLLALIAGVGVLLISYLLSLKGHKKTKKILFGLIIFGIALLGVLYIFRDTNFVQNFPALGRVVNISLTGGGVETRLMAWEIAVEAWQEKPIFGWGPNNYYYAFNKYYKPVFLEHGYQETWFDNAHSAIFNTLAVQGVVGFLLYLGLFAVPIFCLWRGFKKGKVDSHLLSVGSAFLVAHFIHNAFVFENPTSYLYFFFFLAFLNRQTIEESEEKTSQRPISVGLLITVLLVVSLLIYSTNINPSNANKSNLNVIRGLYVNQDILPLYEEASSIPTPHIDDIRNDFARTTAQVLPKYFQANKTQTGLEIFDLAYSELDKNFLLHPDDIRVHIQKAQLAFMGAQFKQDNSYILDAERLLEEGLEKSPKRQQLQYMLSVAKVSLGKTDEAIAILQESIENDPNIGEGWWRLAMVYRDLGEEEKAKEILLEALERDAKFRKEGKRFISEMLPDYES